MVLQEDLQLPGVVIGEIVQKGYLSLQYEDNSLKRQSETIFYPPLC